MEVKRQLLYSIIHIFNIYFTTEGLVSSTNPIANSIHYPYPFLFLGTSAGQETVNNKHVFTKTRTPQGT
jgi:hypothetical protein